MQLVSILTVISFFLNIFFTTQAKAISDENSQNNVVNNMQKSHLDWKDLGIGINNPGEITDWTYFGIKSADEASQWISVLKPLGINISYSTAARLWKQKGFSADEAGEWISIGVNDSGKAEEWVKAGVITPQKFLELKSIGLESAYQYRGWNAYVNSVSDIKELKSLGINSPYEITLWKKWAGVDTIDEIRQWCLVGINKSDQVMKWKEIGIKSPQLAKEWMDRGFKSVNEVNSWMKAGVSSATEAKEWMNIGVSDTGTLSRLKSKYTGIDAVKKIQDEGHSIQEIAYDTSYDSDGSSSEITHVIIYGLLGLMVVTMFMGVGENRKIVIFQDYDDVGLTFLIPVSFILLLMLAPSVGGEPKYAVIFAMVVSGVLFLLLIRNTYMYNNGSIPYTAMAVITKIPLGFLWVLALLGILNPSGNTAKKRRQSRAQSLVLFTLLTPLIMVFIVERNGSLFNPKDWLRYKRVGSIRNYL